MNVSQSSSGGLPNREPPEHLAAQQWHLELVVVTAIEDTILLLLEQVVQPHCFAILHLLAFPTIIFHQGQDQLLERLEEASAEGMNHAPSTFVLQGVTRKGEWPLC